MATFFSIFKNYMNKDTSDFSNFLLFLSILALCFEVLAFVSRDIYHSREIGDGLMMVALGLFFTVIFGMIFDFTMFWKKQKAIKHE